MAPPAGAAAAAAAGETVREKGFWQKMAALASIKASSGSVPCEHIGRGKRGMPSVGRMISASCTGQVSGCAALWLGSQRAKEPAAPPAPAHHHPEQRP